MRIFALLFVVLSSSVAAAQHRESDAVVLARVCAHEAGWSALADCAAIYDVIWSGAARHGMSFRSYAYAYSGRALRGQTSRPWAGALREDGREPVGWPMRGPSWSGYRAQWLALLDYARALVAGDAASTCAQTPHDWGGDMDSERASRLGLIPVDCGTTRNHFYLRPSLVAHRE